MDRIDLGTKFPGVGAQHVDRLGGLDSGDVRRSRPKQHQYDAPCTATDIRHSPARDLLARQ